MGETVIPKFISQPYLESESSTLTSPHIVSLEMRAREMNVFFVSLAHGNFDLNVSYTLNGFLIDFGTRFLMFFYSLQQHQRFKVENEKSIGQNCETIIGKKSNETPANPVVSKTV